LGRRLGAVGRDQEVIRAYIIHQEESQVGTGEWLFGKIMGAEV
jgi:hypothetical protein